MCFRSSFNDFASKHGKDERYRGVDKLRDREDLFKEFVSELRRKEKEESKEKKEKVGHTDVTVTSLFLYTLCSILLTNE